MTVTSPPKRPTLTRSELGQALTQLARYNHPVARELFTQLSSAYGQRSDRDRVTIQQLSPVKVKLLGKVLPEVMVSSTRYVATYRHAATGKEITVASNERPRKTRTFRVPGHGSRKFKRTTIVDTKYNPKESTMAARKSKAANKKAADVEEIEGLEDVEDLEDLEDTDLEEPTDEAEEAAEDELSGMTLKGLRAKAKEAGITGAAKMKKEALLEALTSDEDEEEDDDDDGDDADEFEEMDRSGLRKAMVEHVGRKAKKSESDDDLRVAIRAAVGDDEEEDDEPEAKPAKAKGDRPKPTPPNRELPPGKVGADRIAELAGVDARAVRIFMRGADDVDKYKIEGRWAFTEKQAAALAKKLKASKKA